MGKKLKIREIIFGKALPLLVLFSLMLSLLFGFFMPTEASAAESDTTASIETTDPLSDLDGSVIGGKDFSLEDYPWDENSQPQMIYFAEVGYSMYSNLRENYALYIYVYNPSGLVIDTESAYNELKLGFGDNPTYEDYKLTFLTRSETAGYEGLFYKFKVELTDSQKTMALRLLSSNARVYTVVSIELSSESQVTDYPVGYDTNTKQGSVYTYTGYALGYGSALAEESTLTCSVSGFSNYLALDVEQTVYRPMGDFYEGDQSQLNSCWFSVPDEYIEKYGDISKIKYEWYEYVTKPILVTENSQIWTKLDSLHGGNTSELTNFYVCLIAMSNTDSSWFHKHGDGLGWTSNVELDSSYILLSPPVSVTSAIDPDSYFENFSAVFYTGGKSYKEFSVSAEELQEKFFENSQLLGDTSIVDRYAESLFEDYVQEGRTRGHNLADSESELDIYWNTTTKDSFWQQVFGGYDVDTTWGSVDAFHPVTAEDLNGTDAEVAELLYIDEDDVPALRLRFTAAELLDETVVLFRYGSTNYYSIPVTQGYTSTYGSNTDDDLVQQCSSDWWNSDYSAYMARQTVFLNFDILSITFTTEEGVSTEIPVVMSPQDVFSDVDPPLEEDYHTDDGNDWWWILLIVVLVVVVILLLIFCPQVFVLLFKAIFFVISLPFRAIGALVKAISERRREKKDKSKKDKTKLPDSGGGSGGSTERSTSVVNVYVGGARSTAKKAGGTAKAARTSETAAQGKRAGGTKTSAKTTDAKPRTKAAGGEKKSAAQSQSSKNVTARGGEKKSAAQSQSSKNVTAKKNGK